jgi:hypothetical protein
MRFPLSTELALTIEQHIRAVAAERPIQDKYAYEIAMRHNALPLLRGFEAYYALALTGEVLEFEWRRFDTPTPMLLDGRAYGAVMVGAEKYPALAGLVPSRAAGDGDCEHCQGTGEHPLKAETGDERVICECGGLGFLPSRLPEGDLAPAPYTSSVFPDIPPSKYHASYVYHIDADYDVQSDDALNGLLNALLDDAEHDFVYYRPRDRAGNKRIEHAIREKIIAEGEIEFFHYRRAPLDRNFVHIERNLTDDSGAEYLFGYEKRDVLWYREVTTGEVYGRTKLKLTERARRTADAERLRDRNPFEAKPGAFGFAVDLFKLWPYLRGRFRAWRRGRIEGGPPSD